jgi:hypothetical protein
MSNDRRYTAANGMVLAVKNARQSWYTDSLEAGALHVTRRGQYWLEVCENGVMIAKHLDPRDAYNWLKKQGHEIGDK